MSHNILKAFIPQTEDILTLIDQRRRDPNEMQMKPKRNGSITNVVRLIHTSWKQPECNAKNIIEIIRKETISISECLRSIDGNN